METNNAKLISIIVPVYNVESFLDHCISTILEQTYTNFELILVDDGSKDSSGSICDEWAKKDSRIRVIHQKNGGLSAARNTGLDNAQGDYICFVDSDDFVINSFLMDMVEPLERTGAELAICDIASAKLADPEKEIENERLLSADECRKYLSNPISREYVVMVVAWNKLYRRQLFETNRFAVGRLHEDEFMINHIIFSIDKAVYVPAKNYVYRNNEEGITGKGNSDDIRHLHVIDAYEERIEMAIESDYEDFAAVTFKWALIKLARYYRAGNKEMRHMAKSMYSKLYNSYYELLTVKQQKKYDVFKKSPELFCKLFIK